MARILAIDYGTKRTGIAITDPLQIIPQALDTVPTDKLFNYLKDYFNKEEVEKVIIGMPLYPDGNPAQIAHLVVGAIRKIRKEFPDVEVISWDERFSSEDAKMLIIQSGAGRKKRRDKDLVDKVAATLILKDYLESEVW